MAAVYSRVLGWVVMRGKANTRLMNHVLVPAVEECNAPNKGVRLISQ